MEKAQVAGQIELKEKVTGDEGYQNFMIRQAEVEANKNIGMEQAKALSSASIQMYVTGGSAVEAVGNTGKLISPQSGLNLSGMLETLKATPTGKEIVDAVVTKLKGDKQ